MTGKLRWRRGWIAALVCLLALGPVVSGAGSAAVAAGPAGHSAVPWRQVGPGWVLAVDWPGKFGFPGKPMAAVPVLYLFSPAGVRYRLRRWPSTKHPPVLLDWSGDKARALLATGSGVLEQVVLASGTVSQIHLAKSVGVLGYTKPTGQGLLGWNPVGRKVRLARYHLDGRLAKVLTSDANGITAVYSSSGAELAVSAPPGIWLVSNDGGISAKLAVPGSGAGCRPTRWWDSRTIVASCKATKQSRSRLWLVPASGAKPRPLTAQYGKKSVDPGDIDAWRLGGSLYLNSLGRGERIFRQSAGRPLTAVPVPNMPSSDAILASQGSRLLVTAFSLCSDHSSLLWFNPVTGREQPLINVRPALVGALGAVPFGRSLGEIDFNVVCVGVGRTVRS